MGAALTHPACAVSRALCIWFGVCAVLWLCLGRSSAAEHHDQEAENRQPIKKLLKSAAVEAASGKHAGSCVTIGSADTPSFCSIKGSVHLAQGLL